ncbi:50S ribosomal protein L18 [Candidatus Woesearchaeota archaeon]|jgi:large subunit ribosomal protein L18|nr:50S ribosomal protein L18 [Candidatus Woesearchaeota archaeon]
MRNKPKVLPFKRRREGKTNYKKRLRLLLSKKPRLVIRMTNQRIIAQLVEFQNTGDLVKVGVDSYQLKNYGWNFSLKNMPAAYLTGYLIAKKALASNISQAILDTGNKSVIKGNKLFAFLKGAVDGGLEIPHSEDLYPSEEKISGQHIGDYATKIKENTEVYQRIFSNYLKNKLDPTKMAEQFKKTKEQLEQLK